MWCVYVPGNRRELSVVGIILTQVRFSLIKSPVNYYVNSALVQRHNVKFVH